MTSLEFIRKLLYVLFNCNIPIDECVEMIEFAREKLDVPREQDEWP